MRRALAEDVLPLGDLSASLIADEARAALRLRRRAGREWSPAGSVPIEAFVQTDPVDLRRLAARRMRDVSAGDVIAMIEGRLAAILTAERTALNFLCHLSGVATLTREFVDAAARR